MIDLGDSKSDDSSFTIVIDVSVGENAESFTESHLKERIVDVIRRELTVPDGSEWKTVVSFHHYYDE